MTLSTLKKAPQLKVVCKKLQSHDRLRQGMGNLFCSYF